MRGSFLPLLLNLGYVEGFERNFPPWHHQTLKRCTRVVRSPANGASTKKPDTFP